MRALTPRQKAALRRPDARVATFVEFGHPSGTVYAWSGSGVIEHDGHEWLGAGLVAGITGLGTTVEPSVSQIATVLTGVPGDTLGVADADLKGYVEIVYLGVLSADDRVIDDLLTVDVIDLDTQEARADDDGAFTVVATGQSGFWQLENPTRLLWSPEQGKADNPGDTGFDALAELEDREVSWTRT